MNGSVKKSGATWCYKFRSPQINPATGKHSWIAKGGFRTKAEAADAQRAAIEEAQQGKYVNPSNRTVAEFITEWLEFKKFNASTTTVQGYTDEMNLYVFPRIGGLKLQKLDESRILRIYVELRNGGRIRRDNNRPMYEFWAAPGSPPVRRRVLGLSRRPAAPRSTPPERRCAAISGKTCLSRSPPAWIPRRCATFTPRSGPPLRMR